MKLRCLAPVIFVFTVAAVGCGGAVDDRPAVWDYISPAIIQPNCATSSCHSRAVAVAGLDFSTADSGYDSLLNLSIPMRKQDKATPRPLVTKYQPAESRTLHMMRADGGERMPPDRPLAAADIALFEQWILDGANR